jgi:hypothetical protein
MRAGALPERASSSPTHGGTRTETCGPPSAVLCPRRAEPSPDLVRQASAGVRKNRGVRRRASSSVSRAVRWVMRGMQTPAPFTNVPTWQDLLLYLANFAVFFLVGLASNFYWGAIAAIASYFVWTVWKVKKP